MIFSQMTSRKWIIEITIKINNEFAINTATLFDIGADLNCIREGLVPAKYFEKQQNH